MGKKLITDEGKNELLALVFTMGNRSPFNWLALGGDNSKGAQGGVWEEVSGVGNSYHRVKTEVEKSPTNREIVISGTFEDDNDTGEATITEIGLSNSETKSSDETFFFYGEVANIIREDNVSLKYTIIFSVE